MEFRIKLEVGGANMGYVYLVAYDPDTDNVLGNFGLWRPEFRKFDVNQSALMAGRCWAQSFADFTGFEVEES